MVPLRVFVPLLALFLLSSPLRGESCVACASGKDDSFYCPVDGVCVVSAKQPTTPCAFSPYSNASQWLSLPAGDSSSCPELVCPQANGDCDSCLSNPLCGLCRGFYCLAGTPDGPAESYNATCPGKWAWSSPATTCAHVAPCLNATSCADCTATPPCGYWVAKQTCLPGSAAGSLDPNAPFDAHSLGANASDPLAGWKFGAEECRSCSSSVALGYGDLEVPGFCEACVSVKGCVWNYLGVCEEYYEKDGELFVLAEKGVKAESEQFADHRGVCTEQKGKVKVSALIAGVAAAVGVGVAFLVVVIFVALNVLIWKQGKTAEAYSTLNH